MEEYQLDLPFPPVVAFRNRCIAAGLLGAENGSIRYLETTVRNIARMREFKDWDSADPISLLEALEARRQHSEEAEGGLRLVWSQRISGLDDERYRNSRKRREQKGLTSWRVPYDRRTW